MVTCVVNFYVYLIMGENKELLKWDTLSAQPF